MVAEGGLGGRLVFEAVSVSVVSLLEGGLRQTCVVLCLTIAGYCCMVYKSVCETLPIKWTGLGASLAIAACSLVWLLYWIVPEGQVVSYAAVGYFECTGLFLRDRLCLMQL